METNCCKNKNNSDRCGNVNIYMGGCHESEGPAPSGSGIGRIIQKNFSVEDVPIKDKKEIILDISSDGFQNAPIAIISGTQYFTACVTEVTKDEVRIVVSAPIAISRCSGQVTLIEAT